MSKPGFPSVTPGQARLLAERDRIDGMKAQATPPVAMRAAPIAPARGVMALVQNWEILPGGTRRQDGAHWLQPTRLDVDNAHAVERARAKDPDVPLARAEVFTPGQVAIAARYRDLVEWRAGSGVKCGKLEPGHAGAGGGQDYLSRFMDAGAELAALERAIGDDLVLSPRRHMDRGNARRPLTVRAAVDGMVLRGWSISRILEKAGWEPKGVLRKQVRDAIRGALDRMQGYDA